MKEIKRIFLLVVLMLSVFVLTGCKNKTAISADQYKNFMEGKGYQVFDVTNQFSGSSFVRKVYLATNSNNTYQIEFYDLATVEDAISTFESDKQQIDSKKNNIVKKALNISGKNYSKYQVTSNGMFMTAIRVDNTVIYSEVEESFEKDVKDIIKKLGY